MKHGIDVSYAQETIDWKRVAVEFAYLKGNTGVNFLDAQIRANAEGCHQRCIPFGVYHWVTLNKIDVVSDAKSEAEDFIKLLRSLPPQTLAPALDIEEENKFGISPGNIELWIQTFVKEMADANFPEIVLYSYTPWLNANLPRGHKLGLLPLWIAQYNFKDAPILPFGWNDYRIWQWTAEGKVWGIKGNVDLNVMK